MNSDIPVVDLSRCGLLVNEEGICDESIREVGNMLYGAFTTSGFAYLSNHGIPSELIDEVNEVAAIFFSQPTEEKRKFHSKSLTLDYDPIGSTQANPKRSSDYVEAFRVSGPAMVDENTPWPEIPLMKERLLSLADLCKQLMMRLLKALGIAMKMKDPEYICNCHSLMNNKGNTSTIKLLRYPPVPTDDTMSPNQSRISEHTDWTTLILLFQDQNGGLQAKNSSGEFFDLTPIPGTIIVNLGETLQKWSGGRLRATAHRVDLPPERKNRMNIRRSIAYFGQANNDTLMKKFEYQDGFDHEDPTDQSEGITVEEYMNKRYIEFTNIK